MIPFGSRILRILLLSALLSACATRSPLNDNGALNRPIPQPEIGIVKLDAIGAHIHVSRPADKFVGLALSGGGSRAANFSAAAMEELDGIGILRQVDAISSVSGGGLPGAYYALHGPGTDWKTLRQKMATDFFDRFMWKWAGPLNWGNLAFGRQTKTDLMADVFDEVLFDGKRYADMEGPGPIFLANATDLTNGGTRVAISNEYFVNELGSPLRDFRVANAVAISAAFPGVFDSVTLEQFRRRAIHAPIAGTYSWDQPSFVHLIDGGASDNLGIETLWDVALTRLYGNSFDRMPESLPEKPFVIICIDAAAPNTDAIYEKTADERRGFDRIFNRNVFSAIDALFEGRRRENLIKMGLGQKNYSETTHENFGDISQTFLPTKRTSTFKVPVICRPYWGRYRCEIDFSEPDRTGKKLYFTGHIWHISLDEIVSVANLPNSRTEYDGESKRWRSSMVMLQRLTTQTQTHFKLIGPPDCKPEQLQDALYSAAKVLIRDDVQSRLELCDYLDATRSRVDTSACRRAYPRTLVAPIAESISSSLLWLNKNYPGNLPVRCMP